MKKQTLITNILLVTIIFAVGVIVGNTWKTSETDEVTKIIKQSELDAESFTVEQELFDTLDTNCELAQKRLGQLSEELWKLGKILDESNSKQKLGPENYAFLKRKYHLMQIRTYILDKKLQQDCASTTNVILYYFKQNDQQSKQQGIILDELAKTHDVHIFAVEYNYSTELSFIEGYYDINNAPTLIVNYQNVMQGLTTPEKLTPLLYD